MFHLQVFMISFGKLYLITNDLITVQLMQELTPAREHRRTFPSFFTHLTSYLTGVMGWTSDDAKIFVNFLKKAGALDPRARPTAKELLNDPFLAL